MRPLAPAQNAPDSRPRSQSLNPSRWYDRIHSVTVPTHSTSDTAVSRLSSRRFTPICYRACRCYPCASARGVGRSTLFVLDVPFFLLNVPCFVVVKSTFDEDAGSMILWRRRVGGRAQRGRPPGVAAAAAQVITCLRRLQLHSR